MTGFGLLSRKRLTRLAIFVVAVVQVACVVAPHTGSYVDATPAHPHLHGAGDPLEAPHDEAACPACSGLHLATQPASPVRIAAVPANVFAVPESRQRTFESAPQYKTVLSRAPPAQV